MRLNHELRFGVLALPNAPLNIMLKRFQYIEELGFDVTGTGDAFVSKSWPKSYNNAPWLEPWTLLAALAVKTTHIRIATWITQIPLRNPAMVARQATIVDHLSDGRLELGLGTGEPNDPSYQMAGIPDWSPKEKVNRFREYVEIVDRLLRNEDTSFEGRYYKVKDAVVNPPVQKPRPPIWIAAMGPRMLRIAARYADTWNSMSVCDNRDEQLEVTRRRIELMEDYCKEIDRDPRSLRLSYLASEREAFGGDGLFRYYVSGDDFRDMVKQFVDVGISEFILYYPNLEVQLPMFETIAREVIPELKEKYNK
ncbi:MAG: LLM class flavin-dependent oxidoreductase [Candidatus Thorarchaeota archaeon]